MILQENAKIGHQPEGEAKRQSHQEFTVEHPQGVTRTNFSQGPHYHGGRLRPGITAGAGYQGNEKRQGHHLVKDSRIHFHDGGREQRGEKQNGQPAESVPEQPGQGTFEVLLIEGDHRGNALEVFGAFRYRAIVRLQVGNKRQRSLRLLHVSWPVQRAKTIRGEGARQRIEAGGEGVFAS